jgi:[acyl-carrier-protein] S-malonyltransferase
MGRDLVESSEAARGVFNLADRVLGYKLSDVCFDGPEDQLRQTEYTQPAILVTSIACVAAALESRAIEMRPAMMAGHSIGEYAALILAGSMRLDEGIALVQERARLMAKCGHDDPGTMTAILGLEERAVRAICAEAEVDICLVNDATQIVIGGRAASVGRAADLARAHGARAIELKVSGAFHSRLMRPAVAGMRKALDAVTIETPAIPVIANLTALELASVSSIHDELAEQVASPVRWHDSMLLMTSVGIGRFIEFGPGRMLTTMAKRSFPEAKLLHISDLTTLSSVAESKRSSSP